MTKSLVKSLYIHFPFCRHLCNYCDFYKAKIDGIGDDRIGEFEKELLQAFEIHDEFLNGEGFEFAPLETLYFGGGTPSLWDTRGAEFWESSIEGRQIELSDKAEWTMEVNPGSFTPEGIQAWRNLGVNRFSIGMQTLNEDCLPYLDRVHSLEQAYQALEYFNSLGVNFSVDFMLGIPNSEGLRDIEKELNDVLSFGPAHLSLYILTVGSQYQFYGQLPGEDWVEKEFLAVSECLRDRGYDHYEVSNFGRPGFYSQHNLRYWSSQSVAAIGRSATGLLKKRDDLGVRYQWKISGPSYTTEELGYSELKLEEVYLKLRTNQGLDINDLADPLPPPLLQVIENWKEHKYLDQERPLKLSARGYLMLDSLMDDLFRISNILKF